MRGASASSVICATRSWTCYVVSLIARNGGFTGLVDEFPSPLSSEANIPSCSRFHTSGSRANTNNKFDQRAAVVSRPAKNMPPSWSRSTILSLVNLAISLAKIKLLVSWVLSFSKVVCKRCCWIAFSIYAFMYVCTSLLIDRRLVEEQNRQRP